MDFYILFFLSIIFQLIQSEIRIDSNEVLNYNITKADVESITGFFVVDECIEFKVTHAFDKSGTYSDDPESYINFVISDVQINLMLQLAGVSGGYRYLYYNENEHDCEGSTHHSVKICEKNIVVETERPEKTSTWKLKNELKSESWNNKKLFRFTLSGKLHSEHPTINLEFAKGIYGQDVVPTTTTDPKTTRKTEITTISQDATSPEAFSNISSSTMESERRPLFAVSTSNHELQILIILIILFI